MGTVGIRELKQNAGAVIRRVEGGEVVEVTDRGRPVARIVPLHSRTILDRLIVEGRATPAHGDLLRHSPVALPAGSRLPSEVLAELRSDER
jgi:prevent-host-death family protein